MWIRSVLFTLAAIAAAFAADDGWEKVKKLASGTELRVLKTGARLGLEAKLYEVTEESVIVTTKTEQISIPKDQIQKIEYRPGGGSRVSRTNTVDNTPVNREAARPSVGPTRTPGPSGSSSSSLSVGKASYEVLWTRPRAH